MSALRSPVLLIIRQTPKTQRGLLAVYTSILSFFTGSFVAHVAERDSKDRNGKV
jgi:hypothetical protein